MPIETGIYFFHISFLKEVSDIWLSRGNITRSAEIFIELVSSKCNGTQLAICDRTIKDLITCDRTIVEISKSRYTLKTVPGFLDLISEKSLPNDAETDNDVYSLKVASIKRINPYPTFFLVSDEEKARISALARTKGYTLNIISPCDFP